MAYIVMSLTLLVVLLGPVMSQFVAQNRTKLVLAQCMDQCDSDETRESLTNIVGREINVVHRKAQGEVLCNDDEAKLEQYMKAILTQMQLIDLIELEVMELRIQEKTASQGQAIRFLNEVSNFIDKKGAALIGCWIRDTEIIIPSGFPYFITTDYFPDYLEQIGNELRFNRRWIEQNVTTLSPPLNVILRPMIKHMQRHSTEMVVIVVGANGQVHFADSIKDTYRSLDGQQQMDIAYERIISGREGAILSTLIRVRMRGIQSIVLHCSDLPMIGEILNEAINLNMLTHDYIWYLTYSDIEGLIRTAPGIKEELERAAHFHAPQLIERSAFTRFLLTYDDAKIIRESMILDSAMIMTLAYRNQATPPDILTSRMVKSFLMKDFREMQFDGALGSYGNMTVLPPAAPGQLVTRVQCDIKWEGFSYGRFHEQSGTSHTEISVFMNRTRMDAEAQFTDYMPAKYDRKKLPYFNDKELTVVAKVEPPLVIYNASEPDDKKKFSGVMIELMDHYAKTLNFKYRIIPAYAMDHTHSASMTHAMTVTDYLRKGTADLAIGGFSSNLQRAELVSFTDTTLPCAWSLLTKAPTINYSYFQFATPFKENMWASIFVTFVVVSIMLALMDIFDWTDASFPVRDSFYYVAGVLLSGTVDTNPTSFPSRVLVGCFIFFAIVTFQSYTANMAAFLTTRDSFQGYPANLYDVATRTTMQVILVRNSEVGSMLLKAKKDPYNQIITKADRVDSYEEALAIIKKGHAVLVSDTSFTEYYTANDCTLLDREQDADMIRYAMAAPLGAKYLDAINKAISTVRRNAQDREVVQRWYTQPECQIERSNPENRQTKALTMTEMLGIFLMLAAGFVLSFLTAIIGEILIRCWWKKPGTRFWKGTKVYFRNIPRQIRQIFSVYRDAYGETKKRFSHSAPAEEDGQQKQPENGDCDASEKGSNVNLRRSKTNLNESKTNLNASKTNVNGSSQDIKDGKLNNSC